MLRRPFIPEISVQISARRISVQSLGRENGRRGRNQPEFELIDTGVFDDDRYFDVFVEYAKAEPEDILMLVTVANRGPDEATIHLLPQLWFRNLWSWRVNANRPDLYADKGATIGIKSKLFGGYALYADGEATLLFCDNDTNVRRLFGVEGVTGHFKDAFHEYVVGGRQDVVNPARHGTKAGVHYQVEIPAHGSARFRLRLARGMLAHPFADFDEVVEQRRADADAFYAELQAELDSPDARRVQRQAFAGMIWSKQFFHYDVTRWPKATRPSRRRPGPIATAATANGGTSTTTTSSRCRTNGSTPGTPPGTSRSTASRSR